MSLDAREAAIRAYGTMRSLTLEDVVTDAGISASKPLASREGGRRVLEHVRDGGVVAVIAYKLDRLFRDCADCLAVVRDWDKRSVALHLVDLGGETVDTSSAMGRFFLTVMAGAAELERNLVSGSERRSRSGTSRERAYASAVPRSGGDAPTSAMQKGAASPSSSMTSAPRSNASAPYAVKVERWPRASSNGRAGPRSGAGSAGTP